ncbi:MAG: hypothetical protein SVU32_02315, partial [Candidatus Nanohaloarchaea archaeon]|nr:hypothetical protein [Candidatus Nanohaloarchaea archaeon]
MPEFSCPDCNEQFNSRQKRDEHMQAEHGGADQKKDPLGTRLKNAMTDRKKLAALVFGMTMIGLPFGGAVFYSTIGPSTSASSGGTS